MNKESKTRVLFVCMGNICRSPTAEGVFRYHAEQAGLAGRLEIGEDGKSLTQTTIPRLINGFDEQALEAGV